jgi:hypothetical protein
MTETTTPCEIAPVEVHNSDGVTIAWHARDTWTGMLATGSSEFQSAEAAIDWAKSNGYEPDLQLVARHRLEQAIGILGPYRAAQAIVDVFSVHQLVRFGLEFRRCLEARITAEDPCIDEAAVR